MKKQITHCSIVRIIVCIMALTVLNACSNNFQIATDPADDVNAASCEPKNCVTLEWDPVTTYVDGTPLTVSGYRLYYGPASRYYPKNIDAKNNTTVNVPNLAPGTYYFAVKAYVTTETNGYKSDNSSDYSNEVNTALSSEISVTIE